MKRTTQVRCDRCRADHHIETVSDKPISEWRWDTLLVMRLLELGWRAGVDPPGIGQRMPPDICPDCVPQRSEVEHLRCICAGQGGSVYSSECPIHDHSVDTNDPVWRKRYDGHIAAQQRIKERLGW